MKLLTSVLLGLSALPAVAPAQTLPEKKFPEIVYYADAYADHYQVSRALVHAFITQESGWNRGMATIRYKMGHLVFRQLKRSA